IQPAIHPHHGRPVYASATAIVMPARIERMESTMRAESATNAPPISVALRAVRTSESARAHPDELVARFEAYRSTAVRVRAHSCWEGLGSADPAIPRSSKLERDRIVSAGSAVVRPR